MRGLLFFFLTLFILSAHGSCVINAEAIDDSQLKKNQPVLEKYSGNHKNQKGLEKKNNKKLKRPQGKYVKERTLLTKIVTSKKIASPQKIKFTKGIERTAEARLLKKVTFTKNKKEVKSRETKLSKKINPKMGSKIESNKKINSNIEPNKKIEPLNISIINTKNYASLVVNSLTGEILHQKNAYSLRYPASLTKMMTLYITFEEMKAGRLGINDFIKISSAAHDQPACKLDVLPGKYVRVKDALYAVAVHSANDIAWALAEKIGGNVDMFVKMMNNTARKLGMWNTNFENPNGLHNLYQFSTAYDMAKLIMALHTHYREYYHIFGKSSFTFHKKVMKAHSQLLKKYPGINGLKTGFVEASGYNIAATVRRPEGQLVAVVMGGPSAHARDSHAAQLLDAAYSSIALKKRVGMASRYQVHVGQIIKN